MKARVHLGGGVAMAFPSSRPACDAEEARSESTTAAAREKEMNDNITVVATNTFTTGRLVSIELAIDLQSHSGILSKALKIAHGVPHKLKGELQARSLCGGGRVSDPFGRAQLSYWFCFVAR